MRAVVVAMIAVFAGAGAIVAGAEEKPVAPTTATVKPIVKLHSDLACARCRCAKFGRF